MRRSLWLGILPNSLSSGARRAQLVAMHAVPALRQHSTARQAAKQRHADLRGEPSHANAASGSSSTERLPPTAVKRISDVLALAEQTPVLASREEVVRVATKIASAKRELMFSTVSMDRPQYQLVFLRQWLGHLGAHTTRTRTHARTAHAHTYTHTHTHPHTRTSENVVSSWPRMVAPASLPVLADSTLPFAPQSRLAACPLRLPQSRLSRRPVSPQSSPMPSKSRLAARASFLSHAIHAW